VDNFEPEDVILCEMKEGASKFYRPAPEALGT